MTVNMADLNMAAKNLVKHSTTINDLSGLINDKLNSLAHLSWAGPSASDANQVANTWDNVMTTLYGTKDDPSTGILNILVGGVSGAVQNYLLNEVGIASMYSKFYNAVTDTNAGTDTQHPIKDGTSSTKPYHDTSVNEALSTSPPSAASAPWSVPSSAR